jgi:hypothetical protein
MKPLVKSFNRDQNSSDITINQTKDNKFVDLASSFASKSKKVVSFKKISLNKQNSIELEDESNNPQKNYGFQSHSNKMISESMSRLPSGNLNIKVQKYIKHSMDK